MKSHHYEDRVYFVVVCQLKDRNNELTEVIDKKFETHEEAEVWSDEHKYGDCTHFIATLVNPEDEMLSIKCGNTFFGPFASQGVLNLWFESHCPTEPISSMVGLTLCDENIAYYNHEAIKMVDPMKGVSRRAKVDVTHALTGE